MPHVIIGYFHWHWRSRRFVHFLEQTTGPPAAWYTRHYMWMNIVHAEQQDLTNINGVSAKGKVARDCSQGGILSPILWSIIVDEDLLVLNRSNFYILSHVDDINILLKGRFEVVFFNLKHSAFHIGENRRG